MKITTWNVNSLNVRLPHVIKWLSENPVDVLALQELKLDQDKFPAEAFAEIGYHAVWSGQKTYNGVALISKLPATDISLGMPDLEDPQRRVIAATFGDIRVVDVYCVNGEAVDSEKYAYKEAWFAALTSKMKQELATHENVVLLGDFNIAPDDLDVYDPVKWDGKILCSAAERTWLKNLLDLGLSDSFRHLYPEAVAYTWWDYRMNMFRRKLGLRIDLILVTSGLLAKAQDVSVDEDTRAWERPSDHAPVTITLA